MFTRTIVKFVGSVETDCQDTLLEPLVKKPVVLVGAVT